MATTHPASWYAETANDNSVHSPLDGDGRVDVCVLGAGVTGLNAAIELAERGYSVAVLEAKRVGWGASGRSGGQIIFGYGCDQAKIEKLVGADLSRALWELSLEGVHLVHERIDKYGIDCDYRPGHIHAAIKPRQLRELERWRDDLERNYAYSGLELWNAESVRREIDSPRYCGGLFDPFSGHLHPLNYTLGLARAAIAAGARIYEDTPAVRVTDGDVVRVGTPTGTLTANALVVAANAYLHKLLPSAEAKLMPVGTYITTSEPLGETRCRGLLPGNYAVADINWALDYFRCTADHRLLFGGRVSYSARQPANLEYSMHHRMLTVFPQLRGIRTTHTWGGYIGITVNRAPHFGKAGRNIYIAQGYSGHGLAAGGLAGKLMAEAVAGNSERFDLFSHIKHRNFPGGRLLRTPLLVLAMTWFQLRDRLP